MKIYIGSDHRGYGLKLKIKSQKAKIGIKKLIDMGVFNDKKKADYPIIAERVGQAVVKNRPSLGILICGSGQGVCIAANKIKGIRAISAWSPQVAKSARQDDHANILCLSANYVSQADNLKIVKVFLGTQALKKNRYLRRLAQIKNLENEVKNA